MDMILAAIIVAAVAVPFGIAALNEELRLGRFKLVVSTIGLSVQWWRKDLAGRWSMPVHVWTLWWGLPPRARLYYWRGRARHTAAKARPVALDPVSRGTCTDCKAQDGPCHCGDTLGCTC